MFGLGPWEIAVVFGAIVLIAGPTLLPKFGRYVGKTLTGLRESAESFSENLREEMKAQPPEPPLLSSGSGPGELTDDERETTDSRTSAA